jgi:cobalamin biosynthesis Mg chelatase CobN
MKCLSLQPLNQLLPGDQSISSTPEQPSTGDQTSGAIFDTATYHAATDVAVPAKKSSKVVRIIVWILTLLCVGAAAGAGYFFFTTH